MTGALAPQGADPVRLAYIDALARRASAHEGPVRLLLERKLAEARADLARGAAPLTGTAPLTVAAPLAVAVPLTGAAPLPGAAPAVVVASPAPRAAAPSRAATPTRRPGPLADLTARLDRGAMPGSAAATPRPADEAGSAAEPPELKSLQRDRAAWARLSVEQQLQRALAQVPDNPGPLNSHLLVLRSLRLMQQLSPAYLARFVAQVETLIWLEQASLGGLPPNPAYPAQRPQAARRAGGPRRRRPPGPKPVGLP